MDKLYYRKEKIFPKKKIVIEISLNDDCHNNVYDWSVTKSIYVKKRNGSYDLESNDRDYYNIEKHFPGLGKFAIMHLSNCHGQPIYLVENGMYIMKEKSRDKAKSYLRISDREYNELRKSLYDGLYFKYMLFHLGIIDRWERVSQYFISKLEELCGKKWTNPYSPEQEKFVITLTNEERELVEERIRSGYYTLKAKAEREREVLDMEREEIRDKYAAKIILIKREREIMLYLNEYGLRTQPVVYHDGDNSLVFLSGMSSSVSKEDFDEFVKNADMSRLPEGIKFKYK